MEEAEEKQKNKDNITSLGVIDALKKDVTSRFEEQETKILEVEKTINKTIFEMKTHVLKPESDGEIDFKSVEFAVSEAQKKNINLSRRVQFLSLQQQQANNLSVQKTFSVTKNELFEFENEFDSSIKSTCLLIQRIQNRHKELEAKFKPLESIDEEINQLNNEISIQKEANRKNRDIIYAASDRLSQLVQQNSLDIASKLQEESKKLEEIMEENLKKTESTVEELDEHQSEEEGRINELRGSLYSLIDSIEENFSRKINKTEEELAKTKANCSQEAENIFSFVEDEMSQIYDQRIPTTTLDDDLEYYELEAVLERLEKLEEAVKKKRQEESVVDYEVLSGNDHGVEKRIKCYSDGRFEEIQE